MELACQSSLPAPARVFNHGEGDVIMAMHGMESIHVAGICGLLCQTGVCKLCSGFRLGCHNLPRDVHPHVGSHTAVPTSQISRDVSAPSAMLANLAMITIWCLSVRACSTSEADTVGCLCIG